MHVFVNFLFSCIVLQVINEIVRLANIIPVTFRKVLKDMELDGKLTIKYTHTHTFAHMTSGLMLKEL